jgi:CHAD domain-containing protein
MDYQIGKSESVSDAFHRIGSEVISRMREGVTTADTEGIHEARKGCKWLRASLRLLRSALDRDAVKAELRRIRNVAHMLSGVRDATIRLISFRSLGVEGFDELERRLEDEASGERSLQLNAAGQRKALLAINSLEKDWSKLRLKNGGWRHIGRGVERSYRRARQGFRGLDDDAADEKIHEWRKRAKDLLYHVRLLQPIKPKKMGKLEKLLDDLSDWLGYDHDLIILAAFLNEDRDLSDADRSQILTQVKKHRKEHLTAACHIAELVFQEKPADFTRKLKRWWDRWRE